METFKKSLVFLIMMLGSMVFSLPGPVARTEDDDGWVMIKEGIPGSATSVLIEDGLDDGDVEPEADETEISFDTNSGMFKVSSETGEFEKIGSTGLPSMPVISTASIGKILFAATSDKVYQYSEYTKTWIPVFEKAAAGDIISIRSARDKEGAECLFVVAGRGVYKRAASLFAENNFDNFSCDFDGADLDEPTVYQVQSMAIDYAEVSPEKIRSWRAAAKWKAIMPKLSLSYSESCDDNVEIYTSSSSSYAYRGPRELGNDWGVDMSWDFSDLVFNDAQTSIDNRSKLMVQLRNDILEEVTRLYFERRKILLELASEKYTARNMVLEKRRRVDELTGYIDAYTGGAFSRVAETMRKGK